MVGCFGEDAVVINVREVKMREGRCGAVTKKGALGLRVAKAELELSDVFVVLVCFLGEEGVGEKFGSNGHTQKSCAGCDFC